MDQISALALASKESEDSFYTFAGENRHFILKCACLTCKRIVSESDDEWSIALIAFYEAVRNYSAEKGRFHSFAKMVIKRRLMDYFDSQSKYKSSEIPTIPFTFDGQMEEDPSAHEISVVRETANLSTTDTPEGTPLQEEISRLSHRLAPYGFTLYDIGACSPKSAKTKAACKKVITELRERKDLFEQMVRKRNLPFAELIKLDGVTKKLLERHRKYLIAAAEIMCGDFPEMSEYIKNL